MPESGQRYAVAMWEFSWLVRRVGKEAEYADWDKVLDELAERGYNCIRIDAFPHLVAAGTNGEVVERFSMLPQPPEFMWGNHDLVRVEPRPALVEFINKAKGRDMYVGLSSWYTDDELHRRLTIQSPADYVRIWDETLGLLDSAGLLDRVVWVDVCNEFPLPFWAPGPARDIFGDMPEDPMKAMGVLMGDWDESVRRGLERYFHDSINPLRAKYPQLRYTFSLTAFGPENTVFGAEKIVQLDTRAFDIAEPHIWIADDMIWSQETDHIQAVTDPAGVRMHAEQMLDLYPQRRGEYLKILERQIDFWATWAKVNELSLYTTEAWGPVFYDDVPSIQGAKEWEWVKDVCAEGVRMAVEKGWEGICTSDFCQPHFEGMWADVAWHQKMTRHILQD